MEVVMFGVLLAVTLAAPAAEPAPPGLLTIGTPAPKLDLQAFAAGERVKDFAPGTVYLVEFGATWCVPCLKSIPALTDLQAKHTGVVVLSVFSDDEKTLREFAAKKSKEVGYRLAADRDGAMNRTWSFPACQTGIPHAFIVDGKGTIAWIGPPAEAAGPLAAVVAGRFDPRADRMRLRVEQGAVLRQRRLEEREERGLAEYNRINRELIGPDKLADGLAETEKALAAYADCPEAVERLRGAKVYLLANLPGRREEAVELATDLAIAAALAGRGTLLTNTAANLLNAAERAGPKERDQRLVDLAITLLRDHEPSDLKGRPDNIVWSHKVATLRVLAWAYYLRGDRVRAIAHVRDAIAEAERRRPAAGEDEKAVAEAVKRRVAQLKEVLAEYEQAAGPK
jgi:thiol-disulfide isomerase/thioredoxin